MLRREKFPYQTITSRFLHGRHALLKLTGNRHRLWAIKLKPTSKMSEQHYSPTELREAGEIDGIGLVAGYQRSAILQAGERTLNFPTPAILPNCPPALGSAPTPGSADGRSGTSCISSSVPASGLDSSISAESRPAASRRSRGWCPQLPGRRVSNSSSGNFYCRLVRFISSLNLISRSVFIPLDRTHPVSTRQLFFEMTSCQDLRKARH